MKCPVCGSACKVISTRPRLTGQVSRRYECEDGHRFSTREEVTTVGPDKRKLKSRKTDLIATFQFKPFSFQD